MTLLGYLNVCMIVFRYLKMFANSVADLNYLQFATRLISRKDRNLVLISQVWSVVLLLRRLPLGRWGGGGGFRWGTREVPEVEERECGQVVSDPDWILPEVPHTKRSGMCGAAEYVLCVVYWVEAGRARVCV